MKSHIAGFSKGLKWIALASSLAVTGATVGLVSLVSPAGAGESDTAADLGAPCDTVDLNGTYRIRSEDKTKPTHKIWQKECKVIVTDLFNQGAWQFDLSGKTLTEVPQIILDANDDNELVHRSLKSMRIRTQLVYGKNHQPVIRISIRENLPKVATTKKYKGNTVDTDLEIKTEFQIGGEFVRGPNGRYHNPEPEWIGPNGTGITLRVLRLRDLAFTGPLERAFVAGANWVLQWGDHEITNVFDQLTLDRAKN